MSINAAAVDVTARLNALKTKIEEGKVLKTRSDANIESYGKQREEIVAQLAEYGVTPDGLEAEMSRLAQEVEENLSRAEELLRG